MALETRYRLETPEQIEVEFEVAGPGARFCALIIDVVLQWFLIIGVVIVMALMGVSLEPLFDGDFATAAGQLAVSLLIFIIFMIFVGYYIISEMLMGGQTYGKKQCKIRVIKDDATPITFTSSLIRNFLRTADFLPMFYVVGGMVSLFHPSHKRLGDLAAGTIVVKESDVDYRAETDKNKKKAKETSDAIIGNAELTPAEKQVLASFLNRRAELLRDARLALAMRIAKPLHEKYGGDWVDPEHYIERLLQGSHFGEVAAPQQNPSTSATFTSAPTGTSAETNSLPDEVAETGSLFMNSEDNKPNET